ncbi:hypothetical protein [Polymorphum gilvum]|uniref:Undecaprenyl-phosphate alpha N-acetylglucosaminyltransferase n=1 Tax=Polymorphum gilvum (strain LMG 25793 / CGMCC 1.9160 / SL003B-26A1) TaxID=991905 RepID=F2J5G1_POLGS|nr:hypothetical protein [Polymorphum gilvum]ADZ72331.1 Undecaprenyl-phosphate alpha N-acetylglucosaminyltransferase [Polymorphum gilvum SL003B-26A1]
MWSSKPLDRGRSQALALPPVGRPRTDVTDGSRWLALVYAVALGCLLFNLVLAFVNTRVAGISPNHVMLAEVALIGAALLLVLDRQAAFYAVLVVYFAYMALILTMRPELDLKAVRDALIPIVFYFLGRRMTDIRDVDRLVMWSAGVVVLVALVEYLFFDTFIANVNIFDYYVARGTVEQGDNFLEDSKLFISGVRMEGRNFLAFLGTHRVSSVFLEPVSMGNFGAFLLMWALFRADMARRWLLVAAAAAIIVLGDARFGMFVCLAFLAVAPFYRLAPRAVLLLAPVMVALALAIYGSSTGQVVWEDNLAGRWLHSARLLLKLDWAAGFGVSPEDLFLADSGYAYTLHQIGLVGALGLWAAYVFAGVKADRAWQFKVLTVTYICLLMIVSNSLYSIKTAALLWICAGAADVWAGPAGARRPARSKPAPDVARYSASR